jgi:hypothetical protein
MPYQMQISEPSLGLLFEVWRENVKGHIDKEQSLFPFAPDGRPVVKKSLDKETLKPPPSGRNTTKYMAEDGGPGNVYAENEVIWKTSAGVVKKKPTMTSLFTIIAYKPLKNFLDNFIIDSFQEIWAYDGDEDANPDDKKRLGAIHSVGLYKLTKKLWDEKLVAGGHFNASSNGTEAGMAWLRPIYDVSDLGKIHWGMELASFKTEKLFLHIQEGEPKGPSEVRGESQQLESRLII